MATWQTIRNLGILALFLAASLGLRAQDNFRLMAVSGNVEYSTDGAAWERARTGQTLAPSAKLKLGTGGYAALVYAGRKNYEMKTPGTYSLAKLVPEGAAGGQSVQSKYVDYVVNRSNNNRAGNNMSNLGAVERSMAPTPLTPRNATVLDSKVTFKWLKQSGAPSYYFELKDINGNVLFTTETRDTFVVVDLLPLKLNNNECYWWQIANTKMRGMRSDEQCFRVTSTENRAAIEKAAEEIRANSEDPSSAICNIFLAQYYDEQQVYDRAMAAYEAAIAAQPEVEGYRKIYAEFLAKIGLKTKAAEVLAAGGIELEDN